MPGTRDRGHREGHGAGGGSGERDRNARKDGRRSAARGGNRRAERRTGPPGRDRRRRALRREAPVVIGLLLDDPDFAFMSAHRSFVFDDYGDYLRQMDRLLRSLHAQGTHIVVALFDPDAYVHFCGTTRFPEDSPDTRTRYVAEVATTGPAVHYTRQPMPQLRSELAREADRRATWERATDLLTGTGPCPDCGQDLAHCAFDRASDTLLRIVEAVGPGRHHIVCSLPAPDGPPLLAGVEIGAGEEGEVHLAEADALVVCTIMAAASVSPQPGGLVVRTTDPDGTETVRGWSLRDGEPHPLSEAEVFNAYCTDADTGDPVPPEPGVRHRAGLPLPPPLR